MNDSTFTDYKTISEKFLLGDLIRFMLAEIKQLPPVSFSMLPEKEQQQIIDAITDRTREAVRQVVRIISTRGQTAVAGEITGVAFKGNVSCSIAIAKSDANRLALADSVGAPALIVLPEYAAFLGGDLPAAERDQGELAV